jgi:hypothetical protein
MTAETSDLRLGFAGRGLFESANDGDGVAAEAAWAALRPAVQARFGLDLATMTALPAGAADASLSELAKLMPLGLGMILFGRAMQLLGETPDRTLLLPMLRVAAAGVAALQNALAKRSLRDGLSASIGQILEVEILLALAEAGEKASVSGLIALGNAEAGWRGFMALVNARALKLAGKLQAGMLGELPGTDLPLGIQRSALISLANYVLGSGGAPERALEYAAVLRARGEPDDEIIMSIFTGMVGGGRYAEAHALAASQPCLQALEKRRPPFDAATRNILFTSGLLFMQERDTWRRSASLFAKLRDGMMKATPEGNAPDALFWPCLRGEVVMLQRLKRGEEAADLLRAIIPMYPGAPDDLRKQVELRTA